EVVIERVVDGGRVVSSGSGDAFGDRWDPPTDEHWTYLRVRMLRDGSVDPDDPLGGEDRVWVSPWFVDEPTGCNAVAGAGNPASGACLGLVLLCMAAVGGRRRRV
ncbi:MAG: hypothetical protein GXP62_08080, partial [Oligoflexia bacterium]|nr:hypothetical protein [Oligoflexia bacterium]